MITLIKVDEGPVDIYELRMQYLAKLKETDGVMLPTFIYRNKDLFVTEFKPTCDDQWIMYLTNADGLITKMRIKNGDLMSNCLLYTSPSPRDQRGSRMPSSA